MDGRKGLLGCEAVPEVRPRLSGGFRGEEAEGGDEEHGCQESGVAEALDPGRPFESFSNSPIVPELSAPYKINIVTSAAPRSSAGRHWQAGMPLRPRAVGWDGAETTVRRPRVISRTSPIVPELPAPDLLIKTYGDRRTPEHDGLTVPAAVHAGPAGPASAGYRAAGPTMP
eukprot:766313-Hanusia_phi.AAC.1